MVIQIGCVLQEVPYVVLVVVHSTTSIFAEGYEFTYAHAECLRKL
jgi:hypothetical protein